MELQKLACRSMSLRVVPWVCMKYRMSLHSVPWACMQFLSLSEQLTRISLCLLLIDLHCYREAGGPPESFWDEGGIQQRLDIECYLSELPWSPAPGPGLGNQWSKGKWGYPYMMLDWPISSWFFVFMIKLWTSFKQHIIAKNWLKYPNTRSVLGSNRTIAP